MDLLRTPLELPHWLWRPQERNGSSSWSGLEEAREQEIMKLGSLHRLA